MSWSKIARVLFVLTLPISLPLLVLVGAFLLAIDLLLGMIRQLVRFCSRDPRPIDQTRFKSNYRY